MVLFTGWSNFRGNPVNFCLNIGGKRNLMNKKINPKIRSHSYFFSSKRFFRCREVFTNGYSIQNSGVAVAKCYHSCLTEGERVQIAYQVLQNSGDHCAQLTECSGDDKSTLALKPVGGAIQSPKQRVPVGPQNAPWPNSNL